MDFREKYTTAELKAEDIKEKDKIVISIEAYALNETIQELTKALNLLRTRL